MYRFLSLVCLLFAVVVPIAAQQAPTKHLTFPEVENIHAIRYLPEWRYTGDTTMRGDYEKILHLDRPKVPKTEPLPVVFFSRWGYGAGTLDDGYPRALLQDFLIVNSLSSP